MVLLLPTQVVLLPIRAAAFMEVSLIELAGMCWIPPRSLGISEPKVAGEAPAPPPLLLLPRSCCFLSGRENLETGIFLPAPFLSTFGVILFFPSWICSHFVGSWSCLSAQTLPKLHTPGLAEPAELFNV